MTFLLVLWDLLNYVWIYTLRGEIIVKTVELWTKMILELKTNLLCDMSFCIQFLILDFTFLVTPAAFGKPNLLFNLLQHLNINLTEK